MSEPIPMILHCPKCGTQHVDAPEPENGWTNPPHKSHLCHGCGAVWRPADVPTNGVASLQTRGERDTWPDDKGRRYQSTALQCWFGLSYASFLTLPRVLMEAMPFEWQDRIAALLKQYDAAFPNQPDIGSRVSITDRRGKYIKPPAWLLNYRHPDRAMIDTLRPGALSGDNDAAP